MPGRETQYEKLAREAVERVEKDAQLQEQLSLLPDEVEAELVEDGKGTRGKGKALSQMREYLAAKGYRFPEEVLAQIAGLTQGGDTLSVAMAEAERILAWAADGAAKERRDGKDVDARPTLGQRLATLQQVRTAQLRAADALMPYGAPKASPDGAPGVVVPIHVNPAPSDPASGARDVTPQPVKIDGRMMPADVAHEMQQKQGVSDGDPAQSDAENRTEGPSR